MVVVPEPFPHSALISQTPLLSIHSELVCREMSLCCGLKETLCSSVCCSGNEWGSRERGRAKDREGGRERERVRKRKRRQMGGDSTGFFFTWLWEENGWGCVLWKVELGYGVCVCVNLEGQRGTECVTVSINFFFSLWSVPSCWAESDKKMESLQRDKDVLEALCRRIIQYYRVSKSPLDVFIIPATTKVSKHTALTTVELVLFLSSRSSGSFCMPMVCLAGIWTLAWCQVEMAWGLGSLTA